MKSARFAIGVETVVNAGDDPAAPRDLDQNLSGRDNLHVAWQNNEAVGILVKRQSPCCFCSSTQRTLQK